MNIGAGNAGNVNMRGRRRTHVFSCRCCWCIDDREKLMAKVARKEIESDKRAAQDEHGGKGE